MAKTSLQLREERAKLIQDARSFLDEAGAKEGGPSEDEQARFDAMLADADKVKKRYEDIERLETAEASLDQSEGRTSLPALTTADRAARPRSVRTFIESPEYRAGFGAFLRDGKYPGVIPPEYRDTIMGTDSKGGALVAPVQMATEIVKAANDLSFIRDVAKVVTLGSAKALGVPRMTSRMNVAQWTTEVAAVTEDTTMAFDRRDLTPFLLSKLAKVSIRMMDAEDDTEGMITEELGYQFGVTEEKAYLTGTGTGQPLGVFVASANGIPAARDVTTGNTATAVTADHLFAAKFALKMAYRRDPSCRWLWHRDAIKMIATLKDLENRYLWQPSLVASEPDMLLGIKVAESEFVPNTFTTGLYVGVLGAFRYYWIAQTRNMWIQRLNELYAATNEIGFIGRWFLDGAPVLAEAFVRSKLA